MIMRKRALYMEKGAIDDIVTDMFMIGVYVDVLYIRMNIEIP